MALNEKLKNLSKDFEEKKKEAQKIEQDEQLKSTRARIKELEKIIGKLDVIKGSLGLKSNPTERIGKGMKEISAEIGEEVVKETATIESSFNQNAEALKSVGITNVEQLVESSEFADESEIVTFKNAREKAKALKLSDKALQNRLETLEVPFDVENFSYESAERAVVEKKKLFEEELIQEKMKTPEGKEEIISLLAESLAPHTASVALESPKYGEEDYVPQEVKIGSEKRERLVAEGVIMHLDDAHLVPPELNGVQEKFGKEIACAVLEKVYIDKVEAVFAKLDSEFTFTNILLGDLENRISPEQWGKARKAFEDFNKKAHNVREALTKKSEELKEKGIDFSSRGPSGFGGAWEDYLKPFEYDSVTQEVKKSLDLFTFPPILDYEKITTLMSEQKKLVEDFEEKLSLVDTEDDVKKFYGRSEKTIIGNFQKDLYDLGYGRTQISETYHQGTDLRFVFSVGYTREQELASRGIGKRRVNAIDALKDKDYEAALIYLKDKKSKEEEFKTRVMEAVMAGVALQDLQRELVSESKKEKFSGRKDLGSIKETIAQIEKDKEQAKNYLSALVAFEAKNESGLQKFFFVQGHRLENYDLSNQYERAKNELDSFEAKLQQYTRERGELLKNEPFLFKGEWKKQKEKLEVEIQGAQERVDFLKGELRGKQDYRLSVPEIPERLAPSVRFGVGTNMSLSSGLVIMKENLQKIIDEKLPPSIERLYKEYQALENKLTFSQAK